MTKMPRIIRIDENQSVLGASPDLPIRTTQEELTTGDVDIPPKQILNTNIKNTLKKVQLRRKALKLENAKHEFQEQVQKALGLFDQNEDIYDTDIIMLVCEIAENFFIERGMGEIKRECVIKSCLKYFDNNEKIIDKFIDLVLPNIEQVRTRRRIYLKAKNYFFLVLGCLVKKS